MVDPTSFLVVIEANSAARPPNKGLPRPSDTGYRTLVQASGHRDLVHLHPVPPATDSWFEGVVCARMDMLARHSEATSTVPAYQYWGSALLSYHHVPLLFTVTNQVAWPDKASAHTVYRTPKYQ